MRSEELPNRSRDSGWAIKGNTPPTVGARPDVFFDSLFLADTLEGPSAAGFRINEPSRFTISLDPVPAGRLDL